MIEFKDVWKSYDLKRGPIVKGIHLHVAKGEILALVGASGCGKTTTLKMINRLVEPTSGQIFVDAQDTRHLSTVALRRSIGYIIQKIGLFPHLSIEENMGMVPRLLGWPEERLQTRLDELFELISLDRKVFGTRRPSQLSGGQQQRIGVARALAAGPKIVIMDEPFGALDPITRDDIQSEYKKLHLRLGLTSVMVTHDMTEALIMADRIAVMNSGEIVGIGSPRELLFQTQQPYVTALLDQPRRQARQVEALMKSEAT